MVTLKVYELLQNLATKKSFIIIYIIYIYLIIILALLLLIFAFFKNE